MAKKITATSDIPMEESKKDEIIRQAGVPRTAAEVIRDDNGKVIKVSVNLPATASQAAYDAINRNSGVAVAMTGDITPGTEGTDGTSANHSAFLALPGVVEYIHTPSTGPSGAVTHDAEAFTFTPSDNVAVYQLSATDRMLATPNTASVELRAKFGAAATGGNLNAMYVYGDNNAVSVTTVMYSNGTGRLYNGSSFSSFVHPITDTAYHDIVLEVKGPNLADSVVLKIDDTTIVQTSAAITTSSNLALMKYFSSGSALIPITVDYFRYTAKI